ncbi:unnamed protein product [Clonostachys rhizophaga]|uniref:Uncharacterized protein n=1 Tax=Clonostachys rhizophaga TaxID=160324 RepID=A0A9N9VTB6_9HYPO|nr:unnamed protein product [Clonostachys rhizophaga]
MTSTEFKFDLFLTNHQLSRQAWSELQEILTTSPIEEIRSLPKRKEAIVQKMAAQLPLCQVRKQTVKLDISKLPSQQKHTEMMLTFDLKAFIRLMHQSPPLRSDIYKGMAHLCDAPSEAGFDFTSDTKNNFQEGSGVLLAEPVYAELSLPDKIALLYFDQGIFTSSDKEQRFLSIGSKIKIYPSQIIRRVNIFMDYKFDPSYINTYAIPSRYTSQYYIRYAADCETESLRPIIVTNPHRAELELTTYGRQHFVQNFQPDTMISLPFKMFIDAFGAYRNMYRSLLGVYGLPAFYPDHIASLRSSVIPLTLGPFGADENEVLRSLTYLRELDKGCEIELVGGEKLFVCAFTICFVSDTPQQAKLAGCLNHKATRGCRDCLILSAQ